MNRDRLETLRAHLAVLPDERVDMSIVREEHDCGTVACIRGWADVVWPDLTPRDALGLSPVQGAHLFMPVGFLSGIYTRSDAVAAIQSMLDSPSDDALPVWPRVAA